MVAKKKEGIFGAEGAEKILVIWGAGCSIFKRKSVVMRSRIEKISPAAR